MPEGTLKITAKNNTKNEIDHEDYSPSSIDFNVKSGWALREPATALNTIHDKKRGGKAETFITYSIVFTESILQEPIEGSIYDFD